MKPIELFENDSVSEKVLELIEGAKILKSAKKHLDRIDCYPDFLYEVYQNEFWGLMKSVDSKIFEAIEEVNKAVAYVINRQLNNEVD